MARKPENDEALATPIYVQLPVHIDRKIRELAAADERSLSWTIRRIVTQVLDDEPPRKLRRAV